MKCLWMGAMGRVVFCNSILGAILLTTPKLAAGQNGCDQKTYDLLYRLIIAETVIQITPEDFESRNSAIRYLRQLCRGQKSSYEVLSPIPPAITKLEEAGTDSLMTN